MDIFPGVESQSSAESRRPGLIQRIGEVYRQVFRVYRAWWMYILPFAILVVIPVDVLDSVVADRIRELGSGHFGEHVILAAIAGAITWTSLFGQVFMAGVIGLSLIHAKDGRPPSLGWMARHIAYWRLIAVDLLYVAATLLGLLLLVVPGLLALAFFALAGPVVEIEDRGIKASFVRSFRLVRKDFWLTFWVLATIQGGGVLIGQGIEHLARAVFGEQTLVDSLAEGASSVLLEPLFAVAIVLLALRLAGRMIPRVASDGSPAASSSG